MNTKILLSLSVIAAVAAIAIGGTVAYFSDTETSQGNTFSAGTLNLTLDGANENVVKFTVTDAVPGQSGRGTWTVRNVGSIAGYLDLESISVVDDDLNCNEPELAAEIATYGTGNQTCGPNGGGELGANMNVTLCVDNDYSTNPGCGAGNTVIYNGALNRIASSYNQNLPLAANGGTNYITLDWTIPDGVGNIIQSDRATLNMTFELAQTMGQ
jgi:predicted ribosomally synthesized peptide with SipW-like signal peptide